MWNLKDSFVYLQGPVAGKKRLNYLSNVRFIY